MSSHKEAPAISNDAAADNTDVYAFVSPDLPNTVTLIANFVPLEDPAGGPNFYEFGNDVLYEICIDNNGDGVENVVYQFRFQEALQNPNTFLYNTGPIGSLTDPNWNKRQTYGVTQIVNGVTTVLAAAGSLACPPCNIGPNSTPNYVALANAAIHTLSANHTVFAGQRAEGFYVDLGAIFDLGDLRPFQPAFLTHMPAAPGINSLLAKNINTIAIQVPKTDLTLGGAAGTNPALATSIIGVWARASRQTSRIYTSTADPANSGAFLQVSRQGNPLVNEVIIPLGQKDKFNSQNPVGDVQFQTYIDHPELAGLLNVLYPGVFPHLAALVAAGTARADLDAVLLTGIPSTVVPGFPGNHTGAVEAEMLRLNMGVAPATTPSNLGLIGGDIAGFPNGRRVFDDVTTIELRVIAGAIYNLIDTSYVPDAAAGAITPGLTSSNTDVTAENTVHYLTTFPYLGTPHDGFHNPANNDPASDLEALELLIPVGAPNTGNGARTSSPNTGLIVGGAALAAAAAIGGGAIARNRMVVASGPAAQGADPMDHAATSGLGEEPEGDS
jgi:Domain of unknown function (DUF4331)